MSTTLESIASRVNNLCPNDPAFEELALDIFDFQYIHNEVYREWVDLLDKRVQKVEDIPYLPIRFFKSHRVDCGGKEEVVFSSSGTTGSMTSKHYVTSLEHYLNNCQRGFEQYYGKVSDYCFLGLLPAYLEREGSSLIKMVEHFMEISQYPESGFYLYNHDALYSRLVENKEKNIPTVLFGVTFALLDFVDLYQLDFPELIIMETGGMKGRRKELTREEVHELLTEGFGVSAVHSEYGMTEMLSQGYSRGQGIFYPCATMRIQLREVEDPLCPQSGSRGAINIIDLANFESCAFIATDDLGRVYDDGGFEVLGRLDNSDIRGCNLLIS